MKPRHCTALLLALLLSGPCLADPVAQPATYRWHAGLDESAMLPVTSPSLSPGKLTPRPLKLPGLPRLFLVGDDPHSLAWLTQRGETLQQMRAVGLAIEVADAAALQRLRAAAPGLTILPISGEDIARRLGLLHYPVLITGSALEQ